MVLVCVDAFVQVDGSELTISLYVAFVLVAPRLLLLLLLSIVLLAPGDDWVLDDVADCVNDESAGVVDGDWQSAEFVREFIYSIFKINFFLKYDK